MDNLVKAAVVSIIGVMVTLLLAVALPRSAASIILGLDIPGEGLLATIAATLSIVAVITITAAWVNLVVKLIKEDN